MDECPQCRAGCHHDEACWRYWNHKALEQGQRVTLLRVDLQSEVTSHLETAAMFRRVRDERDRLAAENAALRDAVKLERDVVERLTQLLEAAKAYIKDLEEHEGAEGFSTSTAILGARYRELLNNKE